MKNIFCFIFILALTACSGGLNNKNSASNDQIKLFGGSSVSVYEGTLPCSDCQGIKTTLTLYQNKAKKQNTYKLQEIYIGQNDDKAFETDGTWVAVKGTKEDPNAIVYQLSVQNEDPEDSDVINYLVVDKNTIKLLDEEMNQYESKANYNLTRITD
ncbi:MAG: copper resistance protein NlpE [Bacteroidota bacterium]|nr:copper resistance protein NlpE [Bacteroidota bacterium]MDP4290591.1 copper resistance protein NlpE [Bacteroidota bacterium]